MSGLTSFSNARPAISRRPFGVELCRKPHSANSCQVRVLVCIPAHLICRPRKHSFEARSSETRSPSGFLPHCGVGAMHHGPPTGLPTRPLALRLSGRVVLGGPACPDGDLTSLGLISLPPDRLTRGITRRREHAPAYHLLQPAFPWNSRSAGCG
ncbi:hypothetical protein FKP32DRAFT_44029 [Trametes sanguinea]|nr:hypothetical protein FKP32DRAFT_44029 [Trametes sanguinea]